MGLMPCTRAQTDCQLRPGSNLILAAHHFRPFSRYYNFPAGFDIISQYFRSYPAGIRARLGNSDPGTTRQMINPAASGIKRSRCIKHQAGQRSSARRV
jgi:hypothetical protein